MGEHLLIADCGTHAVKTALLKAGSRHGPVTASQRGGQGTGPESSGRDGGLPVAELGMENANGHHDPVELVAAALAEAIRATGIPPGQPARVVLLAGARRGPRWRAGLRRAAAQAGIIDVQMLETPAAVAHQILASGAHLPDGAAIAVLDMGASATEAAVVRRVDGEFEVESVADTSLVCGDVADTVLCDLATGHGRKSNVALHAVRQAKQTLLHATAAAVMAEDGTELHIGQAELRKVTQGWWPVLAGLVRRATEGASLQVEDLAGIYLCGGSALLPGAADGLAGQLGVPVAVLADPVHAGVYGAATIHQPPAAAISVARSGLVFGRIVVGDLAGFVLSALASMWLYAQALTSTDVYAGSYSRPGLLVTSWSMFGMACLAAVLATACAGRVIVAGFVDDPHSAPGRARAAGILTAAAVTGVGVAVLYAMLAKAWFDQVPDAPVLKINLWSAIPAAALITAGAHLRRWHTTDPHAGVRLPPTLAIVLAVAGLSAARYAVSPQGMFAWWTATGWAALLIAGGALLGTAFAVLVFRKRTYRVYFAVLLALVGVGVMGLNTMDTMGFAYIATTCLWLAVHTGRSALAVAAAAMPTPPAGRRDGL